MSYAIKHKTSGQYFGGFKHGPEFDVIWVVAENATTWDDKEIAVSQALLLRRFGNKIQLKPVAKGVPA